MTPAAVSKPVESGWAPTNLKRTIVGSEVGVLRRFETGGDTCEAEREQWDDGITIQGAELGRGRGGPRCMSCPIEREELA